MIITQSISCKDVIQWGGGSDNSVFVKSHIIQWTQLAVCFMPLENDLKHNLLPTFAM